MTTPFDKLIQDYAVRFDVPFELAQAQMEQESAGQPGARSRVGAFGLFQIMPSTAAWLEGFPECACHDGIFLLRKYHDDLANQTDPAPILDVSEQWKFALAEYNGGPGTIGKARAAAAAAGVDTRVWANVAPFAPEETQHYVAIIWTKFQNSQIVVTDPEIEN